MEGFCKHQTDGLKERIRGTHPIEEAVNGKWRWNELWQTMSTRADKQRARLLVVVETAHEDHENTDHNESEHPQRFERHWGPLDGVCVGNVLRKQAEPPMAVISVGKVS